MRAARADDDPTRCFRCKAVIGGKPAGMTAEGAPLCFVCDDDSLAGARARIESYPERLVRSHVAEEIERAMSPRGGEGEREGCDE